VIAYRRSRWRALTLPAACAVVMGSTGCSTMGPSQAAEAPARPGERAIVQLDNGRFVLCRDCERPTPKTLGRVADRAPLSASLSLAAETPMRVAAAPAAPAASTGSVEALRPSVDGTNALTNAEVARAPLPGRVARRLERAIVIFPTDAAELGEQARARLGELKKLLAQSARVRIVGYTDDTGAQAPNDKLALARANAVAAFVRDLLGQTGRPQLLPSGRGLCCYLVDNLTWGARAANRRVELLIELDDTPANAWLIERHQRLLTGPATADRTATGDRLGPG